MPGRSDEHGGTIRHKAEAAYLRRSPALPPRQREQLCNHLAREVARSRWKLDDDVVNGTELIEGSICRLSKRCFCHLFPFATGPLLLQALLGLIKCEPSTV